MMPYVALFSWPVVTAVLFRAYRLPVALLAALIGGYLLLPTRTSVDLPFFPDFDKNTLPALAALLMVAATSASVPAGEKRPGWLPQGRLALSCMAVWGLGIVLTVLTNRDPYGAEGIYMPGVPILDLFSNALGMGMTLIPFLLARKFLAGPAQQRLILTALCIAGLCYSMLALYEVRMSPQLNNMIYGFFPHSWAQHVRNGGFRPIVFLEHGLWLSILLSGCTLAAVGCWRAATDAGRGVYLIAALWLMMALVLSKSLGALIITLLLLPVILFFGASMQLVVAAVAVSCFLTYPVLRSANLIPVEQVTALAEKISPQRASSLNTRIRNEDAMLAKAGQRPLFGWGGWGRSRIQDDRGQDATISDGYWIIVLGIGGWARYVGEFGLLAFPLLIMAVRRKRFEIGLASTALALVLTGNLIDLIPNATITPLTWIFAGSLWGRLELQRVTDGAGQPAPTRSGGPRGFGRPEPPATGGAPQPVYTRQSQRIYRRGKKPG